MGTFKIDGFCDWHNECDRCGKSELKGTYHITTDTGDEYFLGSSCIKKAYQMTQKEFTAKVDADYNDRRKQANAEWMETEEYKKDQQQRKTFYVGKYETSQFAIDREISLSFAMRFTIEGRPIQEAIVKKYNLRGTHHLT